MNNDDEVVLCTENGLISIAMYIYAQKVLEDDGNVELYDRAMELHYKFKDLDINDE